MYDTIIIGAGMSGLAAGIRLAHFDKRVCILERHDRIGGLNSFYRQRGRNYDVGLHAVTNFTPKGTRRGPLARVLRQLRLAWEELALAPQIGSAVAFPGVTLKFSNDFELFESEVARHFPRQKDNLRRMVAGLTDYDQLGSSDTGRSAREAVGRYIDDELLVEMILCPLLLYGGSREHDMDYGQFSIMFRAIFLEGLARPLAGVRVILQKLVRRFQKLGGELRLRTGVNRIVVRDHAVHRLVLEDGSELSARHILSSAGWPETMRMCDDFPSTEECPAGRLSFVETISVLDKQPRELGHEHTIVFYNDSDKFRYERPDEPVDLRSGVICSPNNFDYAQPLDEGVLRITSLADYDRWSTLDDEAYRLAKLRWYDRVVESAVRYVPDFRSSVIDTDMFTPKTIRRFTGRVNGAVYGTEQKHYDGRTHLENLYICGTDQG
ncbi:MAG: NAD(P)/FAD-dependent oxidoreductase, partial [Candidatus Nealsonbacteria bacterium]|nr:NAD(P)/FAD-dependent oxidoreductase [Candidatus Nealsonbacteria bacterium]